MSKITAVIIDDEFFNRKLIAMLIEKLNPSFTILGEAESIRTGFDLINEVKPQVVFLDIKMPDGSGFDLLKRFSSIEFELVFITGFDQYALLAFDFNALDYVLKPIDSDKFKITLDKVEARLTKKSGQPIDIKDIISSYNIEDAVITKIPIQYNDKVVLLSVNDIMYLQSSQEDTIITTAQSQKHSSSKYLSDFDFIFQCFPNFVRINKDTYININYIHSYSKGFECYLTMNDSTVMEISTKTKAEIIKLLKS